MKLTLILLFISTHLYADLNGLYIKKNGGVSCPTELQITMDPIRHDSVVIDLYYENMAVTSSTIYLESSVTKVGKITITNKVSNNHILTKTHKRKLFGLKKELISRIEIKESFSQEFLSYEKERVVGDSHHVLICSYKKM